MNAAYRKQWLLVHGNYENVCYRHGERCEISWIPNHGKIIVTTEGSTVNEARLKMFDKAKRELFYRCCNDTT